jgi:hypothetical protein
MSRHRHRPPPVQRSALPGGSGVALRASAPPLPIGSNANAEPAAAPSLHRRLETAVKAAERARNHRLAELLNPVLIQLSGAILAARAGATATDNQPVRALLAEIAALQ